MTCEKTSGGVCPEALQLRLGQNTEGRMCAQRHHVLLP